MCLLGSARGGENTWKTLYERLLAPNDADLALLLGKTDDAAKKEISLYQKAKYVWEVDDFEDWSDAMDSLSRGNPGWRDIAAANSQSHEMVFGGTAPTPKGNGVIIPYMKWVLLSRLRAFDLLPRRDRRAGNVGSGVGLQEDDAGSLTLQPRRRRDSSPRSIHVAAAAPPRLVPAKYPRRGEAATRLHDKKTIENGRRLFEFGARAHRYDRFVVTRTDQFYSCDVDLATLANDFVWVPDAQDYGGLCDRWIVAPSSLVAQTLDILAPVLREPERYKWFRGNPEALVKLRFEESGVWDKVRRFGRRMFAAARDRSTGPELGRDSDATCRRPGSRPRRPATRRAGSASWAASSTRTTSA